ncbi:MAG: TRAFs-binding domain-containing protein, partial [Bacteroidota bacterium]
VKWIEHTRQNPADDSPVFQLIDGFHVEHTLTHDKTDVFGKQAKNNNNIKDELFIARNESKESVIAIWESLMPIGEKSVGVVLDLFLSLRAVDAHEEMIDLYKEMDPPLQKTKLVQEQYGFALNRVGKWKRAEKVLVGLIKKYGFDPETNGILGRVYKDLYKKNRIIKPEKADKYLKRSIKCYRAGFDADWRDAYPGVNLITLAEIAGFQDIIDYYLPVVKFAAMQQLEKANYWDLATIAELRVVEKDIPLALEILEEAITFIPDEEDWMLETTLNNLMLIRDARKKRGAPFEELDQLIDRFKL